MRFQLVSKSESGIDDSHFLELRNATDQLEST
jgi:hypothetical protein